MRTIGWVILIWNYIMTAVSDSWEHYFWMTFGLMLIAGSYYLAKR